MEQEKFDFEAFKQDALSKLRNKVPGATPENLFRPLFKQFIRPAGVSLHSICAEG